MGWEHGSVSLLNRCPHWREMGFIKEVLWDAEDVVIPYPPAKSEYGNQYETLSHLSRPTGVDIPTPLKELVG